MFFTPYYKENRGNSTTAKRIVKGLRERGATVKVFAYEEEDWTVECESFFHNADIYHVIHLKRFAMWLNKQSLELKKPYILTSGGTDINEDIKNPEALKLMNAVAYHSCAVTVFSEEAKETIIQANSLLADRVFVIPQSVELPEAVGCEVNLIGEPIFLLPAGLRPVKDVFYLWDELVKLRSKLPHLTFYIIGPVLDEDVHQEVINREKANNWFHYLNVVPLDQMRAFYTKSDFVLNTSISEGQSAAVLEAMLSGKVVLARNNTGNASVITDQVNGVLYENPVDFHDKLIKLVESQKLTAEISRNAEAYIKQYHSLQKEMDQYEEVYTHCLEDVVAT